ncbi:MAG TPA: cation:proton antiporter [Thermomicrobiaceae bacterium]|nr:cation:proton antiporter [Thermomicrobiaceae bacterium]
MDPVHQLIITATAILVTAALGQILAPRIPVPLILIYLALGVVLGPSLLGVLAVDELGAVLPAAVRLAVAIIVFEGAFSLETHYLRQVRRPVRNLVTLGLAVTVVGGLLLAHFVAGLPWSLALLYGALVSVTGPTVITPLLQRVRVNGRVRTTLAGEGIIIDPIGAVAALVVYFVVTAEQQQAIHLVRWVLERLVVGALWGLLGGLILLLLLRQLRLDSSQTSRLLTIGGAALIYTSIDTLIPDAGLAAAVAAGLLLGNLEFPHREEVHRFAGDITVIVIATVYLLLAASLDPDVLVRLGWRGPLTVLGMMLLVRPLGVVLSTAGTLLRRRERAFVAAIGPRGVVAASLATLLSLNLRAAGVPGGDALLGLVFLTIVITIAVQASYADWLARRLGVLPMDILIVGAGRVGRMLAEQMLALGEDVTMVEPNPEHAEQARELGARVVVGDGTDVAVLERAGIAQAKTVVAATASDKDNLLICQLARTRFGREQVVARVTDPEAVPSFEELGIQVMNPARSSAMILANLIRRPNLFRLLSEVSVDGADVTEVVVRNPAVGGTSLKGLGLPKDVLVLLLRRGGQRLIPHGDTVVEPGDVVTLVGSRRSTEQAAERLLG